MAKLVSRIGEISSSGDITLNTPNVIAINKPIQKSK